MVCSSLKCTICVICIYKLKWLEIDLVWHCLKNPRYHHWYHVGHRKKAEYRWSESRIQKEGALVPGQLILMCLRNQAHRTWPRQRATPGKQSGHSARVSACILIACSFLLFSFKWPHVPLGNVFVWDLKPDLSVVVERFPQKRCFRGLRRLWEGFKYSCINIVFVISKLPREKLQFPVRQKVKILIDPLSCRTMEINSKG